MTQDWGFGTRDELKASKDDIRNNAKIGNFIDHFQMRFWNYFTLTYANKSLLRFCKLSTAYFVSANCQQLTSILQIVNQ